MPKIRLTDGEKRQRGTWQAARAAPVRDLATVQADIVEVEGFIRDLRFTARSAAASIRKLGATVPVGRGAAEPGRKCHPGVRIQTAALEGIQRLKRDLTFLREEEKTALALVKPEHDEFEGLD